MLPEKSAAMDMDNIRVFQCPKCKEYVNTSMSECRFCHAPIDSHTAKLAADHEEDGNRLHRTRDYLRHIWIGLGLLLIGVILTFGVSSAASSDSEDHYFLFYGAIVAGLLDLVYGLFGWWEERKGKRTK